MTTKIARFIRELECPAPRSPEQGPQILQLLFKVTPAMAWTDYVTWRKGRLLNDLAKPLRQRNRFPHRMKTSMGRGFFAKSDPKYGHGQRQHTTAFVVASASDLKSYMNAANARMVAMEEGRIAYYKSLEPDKYRDESIAKAEETKRLFDRAMQFEVETYLFPADKFGEIKDYSEMDGSQKGTLDHRKPFEDVGYTVVGDLPVFTPIRWPKPPLELEVEVDLRPVIEIKDWEVL
jgi:hypothetical protein